jgi:hypothetical protein
MFYLNVLGGTLVKADNRKGHTSSFVWKERNWKSTEDSVSAATHSLPGLSVTNALVDARLVPEVGISSGNQALTRCAFLGTNLEWSNLDEWRHG